MIDRYVDGTVRRISPEAPVPILSVDTIYERAGGAANVAVNLAVLGAEARLLTVVGDDGGGEVLRRLIAQHAVTMTSIEAAGHPTIQKVRYVAQRHQLLRADTEIHFSEEHAALLAKEFTSWIDCADLVIFSDYAKGSLRAIQPMIATCRTRKVPCIVDPKGPNFAIYKGASVIKPNATEFSAIYGAFDLGDPGGLSGRAATACQALDVDHLLVTLGEHGMALYDRGGLTHFEPSMAREVFDVSGAGDTVIAALAYMMADGRSIRDAVITASAAAGLVVQKFGTATVAPDELATATGGLFGAGAGHNQ